MKLYIKNMVSDRCKMTVKSEMENLGLQCIKLELCEVECLGNVSVDKLSQLDANLKISGLGLLNDKKTILIEQIKVVIIELVHYSEKSLRINLSDYLSEKLHHNYTYLANIFSEIQGNTIEHFYIFHKIEKIKELLFYDELNITEIAYRMHYHNVAHLSSQFKKVTGLTPSEYKHLSFKNRKSLDNV